LQRQFSERLVEKTYQAIVEGTLSLEKAVIDMPIERNPKNPQTFRVGPHGKPATTTYETVERSSRYCRLVLKPKTGRTHQLRVHLKQIGHPIVGDSLYGGSPADRLYLHAASLAIVLPDGKQQTFEAPLPKSFNEIMAKR
jgi:23S rRNA-/tRNA-specific pseudouridylate synthase